MDFGFNMDTLNAANKIAGTGYQPQQAPAPVGGSEAEGLNAMGDPKKEKKGGFDLGSLLGAVLAFI
jgi:hypothetical protein